MFGHYKQYNYGDYIYAGEPASMSACGAFALANLTGYDPVYCMDWLTNNGYASNKQGTIWGGINDFLNSHLYESKLLATGCLGKFDLPVFEEWKQIVKAGYAAILLMGNGKNNYWTKGGHYIAVIEYDISSDRYLVVDSASDARDGWHRWEDFNGNIKNLYTSNISWGFSKERFMIQFEEVKYGDCNAYVLLAQKLMKAIGKYHGALDGLFGDMMLSETIGLQLEIGMAGDGVIGRNTIDYLTGGLAKV